jgi:hypothetical protein
MHEHHKHVWSWFNGEGVPISRIRNKVRQIVAALRGISSLDLAKAMTGEFEQVLGVARLASGERPKLIDVIK